MKGLGTILSLFVLAVLATARFAGADAIMAAMPPHYGERLVNTLGVLTAIAAAIVLDRLVRALYWDGYLRRKLKRETPAVIESLLTIALVLLGGIAVLPHAGLLVAARLGGGGLLVRHRRLGHETGEEVAEPEGDVLDPSTDRLEDSGSVFWPVRHEKYQERNRHPGEALLHHPLPSPTVCQYTPPAILSVFSV